MRLLGMILALGAIGWLFMQSTGDSEDGTAIPKDYQQALDKAEGVEQNLQDATEQRLKALDEATK